MILTVDIGNTNTVLGVFDNGELIKSVRLQSNSGKTVDELEYEIAALLDFKGVDVDTIEGAILSSVVPIMTKTYASALQRLVGRETIIVGPGTKTGLNILYDDPKEVGADRIVNAVGALEKYEAPMIIIDFGTATTYCVIDDRRNYLGGIIAPGIGISAEALFTKTAKLPRVELSFPDKFLNKNTVDAIRAGVMYSKAGEVDYLVAHLKSETGLTDARVIATGGLAKTICKKTKEVDMVDDDLTLWGLKKIYEKTTSHRK